MEERFTCLKEAGVKERRIGQRICFVNATVNAKDAYGLLGEVGAHREDGDQL